MSKTFKDSNRHLATFTRSADRFEEARLREQAYLDATHDMRHDTLRGGHFTLSSLPFGERYRSGNAVIHKSRNGG